MSPINLFNIDDMPMYTPEFSLSPSMPTVREDSPFKEDPTPMKKTTKRGQRKKTVQNDDGKRCIAWTVEEEIALCKGRSMSRDRAKKKGVSSSASSTFGNEEALARLMIEGAGTKAIKGLKVKADYHGEVEFTILV
ncbi:hypothetical protein Tco_1382978 [Tanacetum coccineum]